VSSYVIAHSEAHCRHVYGIIHIFCVLITTIRSIRSRNPLTVLPWRLQRCERAELRPSQRYFLAAVVRLRRTTAARENYSGRLRLPEPHRKELCNRHDSAAPPLARERDLLYDRGSS